jgi:chromosome segregation ATPase
MPSELWAEAVRSIEAKSAQIRDLQREREALRANQSLMLVEQSILSAMRFEVAKQRDDAIAERDDARRDAISAWAEYAGEKETSAQCLSYLRQSEDMVDALTAERDAAVQDAATLADSIEDFIGSQGTAYEPDQYRMLCGVVRDYNARTADAGGA